MFTAQVADTTATVLLDSGASRDFISSRFVADNSLPTSPLPGLLRVRLANGSLSTSALGCQLPFSISTYSDSRLFTITELQGYDIILGMPFLKQYNPVIDWQLSTVTFSSHALSGSSSHPSPRLQVIDSNKMDKILRKNTTVAWICTVRYTDDYDAAWDPSPPIPDPSSSAQPPTPELNIETDLGPSWGSRLKTALLSTPARRSAISPPSGLAPPRPDYDFRVPLPPDHKPLDASVIRMSPLELQELRKILDDYLAKGWIRPSVNSPYGAPCLFARKPDGSLRLVISYKKLNAMTIPSRFPLPRIDDLLDQLHGATCATVIDLASGYHQLRVHPDDVPKLAFKSRYGQFEWLVMPMGTTSSPSYFSRFMSDLLRPLLDKGVLVYLDDILIYAPDPETLMERTLAVIDLLAANDLHISLKKSKFGRTSVKFLGHRVSFANGSALLSVDPDRIAAVQDWPLPRTISDVRSFLGFTGFVRRFIRNYASIAHPLTELTKTTVPFPATLPPAAVTAFQDLKAAMTSAPCLAIPSVGTDSDFVIYTDASTKAIGCVLLQPTPTGLQPVAYDSRKLKPEETRYPVHELELLAVIHALSVYRTYVEGCRHLTLCTDHASLRFFLSQPHHSGRQARWLDTIQPYAAKMDIVYKRGDTNHADALSRRPDLLASFESLNLLGVGLGLDQALLDDIKAAYSSDPLYAPDARRPAGLRQEDGLWFLRDRICIPNDPSIRVRLLQELHDAPYAGHPGITKTLAALSRLVWFPRMKNTVTAYVNACPVCQRTKPSRQLPPGLLQPHAIPTRPWTHVSMDWITDLPPSNGFDSILTVVDMFSKYAHFIPCNKTMTSAQLASTFLDRIVALHGLPSVLVADRDPRTTAELFSSLLRRLGTKMNLTTAYHPASDGQVERVQSQLQALLRAAVRPLHDDWLQHLPTAQLAYNSTPSSSTGVSPFAANFGYEPNLPITLGTSVSSSEADAYLDRLRDLQSLVKSNLEITQARMKRDADEHRRPLTFSVGDRVRLTTQFLRLKDQPCKKFRDRYIGPFTITSKISDVVYRLALPSTMKCHPVFHISKLLPATSDTLHPDRPTPPTPTPAATQQPYPSAAKDNVYDVDSILGASFRPDHRDGQSMLHFRVRWAAPWDSAEHDTDEPFRNLANNVIFRAWLSSPDWAAFRRTAAYSDFVKKRSRVLPKTPDFAPLGSP